MTIMMVYYYIQNICGHSYYMTLHGTIFFVALQQPINHKEMSHIKLEL